MRYKYIIREYRSAAGEHWFTAKRSGWWCDSYHVGPGRRFYFGDYRFDTFDLASNACSQDADRCRSEELSSDVSEISRKTVEFTR